MTSVNLGKSWVARPTTGTLICLFVASVLLPHIPILNMLLMPMNALSTIIHELGHALACVLTGGSVAGMTIVPDGAGHGGLTFCRGGNPFVYTQTGYLGTTLAGCGLIALGRFPQISKGVLFALGLAFGAASLTFMFSTVLHGALLQGFSSMVLGLCLSAAFIIVAFRLNAEFANYLLLFLGVQMGLTALSDVGLLMSISLGWLPNSWSDASNMGKLTGLPAFLWAALWGVMSLGMLGLTIYWTYKADNKR